ncbi:SDR family NAD(P)-dependent oxidoreductase [Sorangium sp. So ce448]|uniref:SDR family NAD(P)-dependent oxidoreductase n=1 Tax=Sorangium sp. So ce448 TaxID=3133314 RepID=UPI003F638404
MDSSADRQDGSGECDLGVAIIGMAGRFPGADNVGAFWDDLVAARDVLTRFHDGPERREGGRRYVDAGYILGDIAGFDAGFFAMTPREAAVTDPQHRLFLECAWEALEHAGYVDEARGTIGVYAGANFNTYLYNVCRAPFYEDIARQLEVVIGNDKDYLATRVSYKLNLTGPSVSVQTACSSSLVGVALAAQALLNQQCDLAVVGGVGVRAKQEVGYWTDPDEGLLSGDGRCRPFDAEGSGVVEGNGVAVIVLKRLSEAIADRDTIHATIRGFAINNDGAGKIGYTAPSVAGQQKVIGEALALAAVDPSTVAYVEAHGTGTRLGDPIEVEALGRYYGRAAGARCVLGSVKSNIGHLDAAAGVVGLIKAALCLKHRFLPATLHYKRPNPAARLEELGFSVLSRGESFPAPEHGARRAAVSSLGIGGTNAHVVLEEPPSAERARSAAPAPELLVVSARSRAALESACQRLAEHLARTQGLRLADVAYTLQVGRKTFEHRRFVVAHDVADAARALTDTRRFVEGDAPAGEAPVAGSADARAAAKERLGRAWLAGAPVDFRSEWAGREEVGRVPLPTYPFERERHWIDAPASEPEPAREATAERRPVAEWLYAPSWRRSPPIGERPTKPRRWLVFADRSRLAAALIEALEQRSNDVIVVSPGAAFAKVGAGRFQIDPSSRADHDRLLEEVSASGAAPPSVLHLWSLTEDSAGPLTFEEQQRLGFFGLLRLSQAIAARGAGDAVHVVVLTDQLFSVLGDERIVADKATLLSACSVLPQEIPSLRCRVVDVTGCGTGLVEHLLRELGAGGDEGERADRGSASAVPFVAYRNLHRWVAAYEPIRVFPSVARPRLRDRGVYLVVGGLGAVGMALSEHLARAARARLIVTSRAGLIPRDAWDAWMSSHDPGDRVSRQIAAVQRLERLGAEVLVLPADVADEARMAGVVAEAYRRFGALHGVIHAAGTVGPEIFRDARATGPEHARAHFQAKVQGTRVLERVLSRELDFVLLCSSLSTILGGIGFAAYAAANHFQDAFAIERIRKGDTPWIAVDWDAWQRSAASPTSTAIRPEEGGEALEAILSLRTAGQIVVSTVDLAARWEQIQRRFTSTAARGGEASQGPVDPAPPRRTAGRPALGVSYAPPRNDLERCLADIWQDALGVEPIGIHDAFRDLGGESLAAMPLVARIAESFRVKLPIARFFAASTIARLAEAILEIDPVEGRAMAIATAVQKVKRMSPDEVRRALDAAQNR